MGYSGALEKRIFEVYDQQSGRKLSEVEAATPREAVPAAYEEAEEKKLRASFVEVASGKLANWTVLERSAWDEKGVHPLTHFARLSAFRVYAKAAPRPNRPYDEVTAIDPVDAIIRIWGGDRHEYEECWPDRAEYRVTHKRRLGGLGPYRRVTVWERSCEHHYRRHTDG